MDAPTNDYDHDADFLWSIQADLPHRVKDCPEKGAYPNHHPTGELHPLMLSCARSSTAMTNFWMAVGGGEKNGKIDVAKISALLELGVNSSLNPKARYIYSRAMSYFIDKGHYFENNVEQDTVKMVLDTCRPWSHRNKLRSVAKAAAAPPKSKSSKPKM